jgi:hypothetical protein
MGNNYFFKKLIYILANRIAEKAVEALRRSRQYIQRQRADAGTPTWTGRSGFSPFLSFFLSFYCLFYYLLLLFKTT